MKRINYISLILLLTGFILSCKNIKDSDRPSIYRGNINVGIDESLRPLLDAEMAAYSNIYKGATFNAFNIPENEAFKLLLEDSMNVIAVTRDYNEEEMEYIKERGIEVIPGPMALDAVVLINNKDSEEKNISLDQLRKLFTDESENTKLVFDVGNSSNLNVVLKTLGISEFNRKNVVSAGGNDKVIEWIQKDKNAIGFIGYNIISEKKDENTLKLRNSINTLGIQTDEGPITATNYTITERTYPFYRIIYLHTLVHHWGVENGFIRYACTKPGQLIVEKMGMVPYYIIAKEFYLSKESLD